jgi:para-nitrobenzyl esterase
MEVKMDGRFDRRRLFTGAAALAGGAAALAGAGCSSKSAEASAPAGAIIVASDRNAVVDTTSGKVRGFTRNGIQTFKGIPYAADAGGARRFLAPAKPEPWTGVRSAMWYGPTCPQAPRTGWHSDENAFLFQWDDGQPGEDCLRVNLWTPGTNDGKKRPVMVWLHGGGWAAGSGQEQPAYNGENLSRRGDVVVVSLNHRLNMLGYMNLASYGEKFASSMNAGVLDLVAALEWVRDNIANFGGDPGNVLIFGQSGGGGKVSTLCSMAAAKGLFHRAVVQSGSTLRLGDPEMAAKLAAATLSELDITKASIDKIQTVPYDKLLAAQAAALKKLQPTPPAMGIGMPSVRGAAARYGFSPVVDGKIVARHPFDPDAPDASAGVPMLIGTVLNEMSPSMSNPALESMSEEDMRKRAEDRYHDKAGMVADAYRKAYPDVKPVELLSRMMSVRTNAVTQAELKAAQKGAPAYMYLFAWHTPVLDGRPRAFHCSEIPFVFANSDVSAFATGGTAEARELAGKVSDAWIHFARSGDPNHSGLPKWPAYSADAGPVMVFDTTCEVKNDPDRELRKVVASAMG